ncbi:MAG: FIST C-terminal domain-containing protein [Dehalococcoidales bacterium]|nr:FIST C-terminal domain-containing protein [Dehalococcoidales bacterium]
MKVEQIIWPKVRKKVATKPSFPGDTAQLVLVFGTPQVLKKSGILQKIRKTYPGAHLLGCSTAGEISGIQVLDNTLVTTAVYFEHTQLKTAIVSLDQVKGDSYQAGASLGKSLEKRGLVHVFAISDGLAVNGSELVKGLMKHLPDNIHVTGGLAADSDRFQETLVVCEEPKAKPGIVAVLGLYSDRLKVGYGSVGGWDPFGPERLVTRSTANILYELDGRSALELYKEYLGEHAHGLPATGLLFPLNVRIEPNTPPLVRTILAVSEKDQSLTFAGDIPEGSYARLMKANLDRLIDGSVSAARLSYQALDSVSPDLAILISCVGRKLVLRQRTEEEVEGVREVLGNKSILTGYYSYGELCPSSNSNKCDLHNQTMTITALLER